MIEIQTDTIGMSRMHAEREEKMSLQNKGALFGTRYRVIVTTDIGGSDYDDYQSMVHYLLYSDLFDTEGLISSAWGDGRVDDILEIIDAYEKDYPKLKKYSEQYPTPEYLRSITKQGAIEVAPYKGYAESTPASELIIQSALKEDDRPLYILGWGLLEDIAQALHDAPQIRDKIRINYVGGPNKKWGLNAYEYILREFPDVWMIEDNSSFMGWFVGGNKSEDIENHKFVELYAKGHGALGDYFASEKLRGTVKMGDTPTVAWLLNGTPEIPENDSWGGRFERVWNRPRRTYHRNTTLEDKVEEFEVIEYIFDGPVQPGTVEELDQKVFFRMIVEGQSFPGYYCGNGEYRMRFMPKKVAKWKYVLESEIAELNGQSGEFESVPQSRENRIDAGQGLKNWWADILDPEWKEGEHEGARTINQYREAYLRDFAERFDRCL